MKEIWKVIEGWEKYEVSNCGNIKDVVTGNVFKGRANKQGQITVDLWSNDKKIKRRMTVSRLVEKAFG